MARPEEPEENRVHRLREALRAAKEKTPRPSKILVYRNEFDQPEASWEDSEVDRLFKKVGRREAEGAPLGDEEPLPADLDADLSRFYGGVEKRKQQAERDLPGLKAQAAEISAELGTAIPTDSSEAVRHALKVMHRELDQLQQITDYDGEARLAALVEGSKTKDEAVGRWRYSRRRRRLLSEGIEVAKKLKEALRRLGQW